MSAGTRPYNFQKIIGALHEQVRILRPELSVGYRYSAVGAAQDAILATYKAAELKPVEAEVGAMHPEILHISLESSQFDSSQAFNLVFHQTSLRIIRDWKPPIR